MQTQCNVKDSALVMAASSLIINNASYSGGSLVMVLVASSFSHETSACMVAQDIKGTTKLSLKVTSINAGPPSMLTSTFPSSSMMEAKSKGAPTFAEKARSSSKKVGELGAHLGGYEYPASLLDWMDTFHTPLSPDNDTFVDLVGDLIPFLANFNPAQNQSLYFCTKVLHFNPEEDMESFSRGLSFCWNSGAKTMRAAPPIADVVMMIVQASEEELALVVIHNKKTLDIAFFCCKKEEDKLYATTGLAICNAIRDSLARRMEKPADEFVFLNQLKDITPEIQYSIRRTTAAVAMGLLLSLNDGECTAKSVIHGHRHVEDLVMFEEDELYSFLLKLKGFATHLYLPEITAAAPAAAAAEVILYLLQAIIIMIDICGGQRKRPRSESLTSSNTSKQKRYVLLYILAFYYYLLNMITGQAPDDGWGIGWGIHILLAAGTQTGASA